MHCVVTRRLTLAELASKQFLWCLVISWRRHLASILREGSWEFQVRLGLGINLELLGHHRDKTKSVGGSSKCFNMRVC